MGDKWTAVRLYDRAIQHRDRQHNADVRLKIANDLEMVYLNKAVVVSSLSDNRAAVGLYDRAIEILERLANVEGRRELAGDLARVKAFRGMALIKLGDT